MTRAPFVLVGWVARWPMRKATVQTLKEWAGLRCIVKMHRDQCGGIGILTVLFAFVFVALIAMVWNTGEVSVRRMRAQTVADAAAYSAAQWNARTVNVITATNMVSVRTASAQTLAMAVGPTLNDAFRRLDYYLAVAKAAQASIWPPTVTAGILLEISVRLEQGALLYWMGRTTPALLKIPSRESALRSLRSYQSAVVDQTPRWVKSQKDALQQASGHRLYLTQAAAKKPGVVTPPLRRGNFTTVGAILLEQVYADRRQWDRELLRKLWLSSASSSWRRHTASIAAANALRTPHHVLVTQTGPSEFRPTEYQRNTAFAVLALATTRSGTRPRPLIPSFYGRLVREVTAYAAAETFNGNENMIRGVTGFARPWRVWSKAGWFWRPRLTEAEAMRLAEQEGRDRGLERALRQSNIRFHRGADLEPVNHH